MFWVRPLHHWDRILVCAFSYVNGLNTEVLIEWVILMHLVDAVGIRHIGSFFRIVERQRERGAIYRMHGILQRGDTNGWMGHTDRMFHVEKGKHCNINKLQYI
jgi:hypothetical protein